MFLCSRLFKIAAFVSLLSTGTQALAESLLPRAFRFSVTGTGLAVEEEAVRSVRKIIGDAFSDSIVESIVHEGYGFEGGFLASVTVHQFAPLGSLTKVYENILSVPHNTQRTGLGAEFVESCK